MCLAATFAIACSNANRLFQRLRLLAGPRRDLGLLRPGRENSVGFGLAHRRHIAADTDLPAQRFQ